MKSHARDRRTGRPHPGTDTDDGKLDYPTELTRPSWAYILKKTVREFMDDQGTDMAAACRIIILEDQLEEALRQNERHQGTR